MDSQKGLRYFFFASALACVAGLSLRLFLNPTRLGQWIDHALGDQGAQIGLHYKTVRLSLAHGSIPQLAIELGGLEVNPARACVTEPSVRVATLRLPLSFPSLLRGHLAIGVVSAQDMKVDLDALKKRCDPRAAAGTPIVGVRRAITSEPAASVATSRADAPAAGSSSKAVAPWWSAESVASFRDVIAGFEFSRVELAFENGSKHVDLDSFLLEPGEEMGSVRLETDLMIPPELAYGERLPKLRIEGTSTPTEASVVIKAEISEGRLQARAKLSPAPGGAVETSIRASIESVPLSTLEPLLTKSGIVKGAFRPRFMWMSCEAAIRGKFQGLFAENKLELSACEIEGNGARIRAESATHRPDGTWEPFYVALTNVDLGQILEVFAWQGPDGVFSDYGRLDGQLSLMSGDDARLTGAIKGAQVRFSSRNVRADQRITQMNARIELDHGHLKGTLDQLALEGGEFDGGLDVSLSRHATEGSVAATIGHLRLSEAVQKVLVGGRLDDVSGRAVATLDAGQIKSLTGQVRVSGLAGRELRLREATVQTEFVGHGRAKSFTGTAPAGEFLVTIRAPELELHESSPVFRALKPLFFAHRFPSDWVVVADPLWRARIGAGGEIRWEKGEAALESGRIRLSSSGSFGRDRDLDGLVWVDYPGVKKLKWKLGGRLESPTLTADSRSIADVAARGGDDHALGLPVAAAEVEDESSMTTRTKEGLRALRDKVVRGAKTILPTPDEPIRANRPDQRIDPSPSGPGTDEGLPPSAQPETAPSPPLSNVRK